MLFDRLMRRRNADGRFGRMRNGVVMLGRYELLHPLGVGGMAQVFKARAVGPGGFERDVVVKRILPEYGRDSEFIRMFVDEAKLLGLLHHPNVVQVYDFGEDDGALFLALEYVEGPSLSRVLRTLRGAEQADAAGDRGLHRARDLPRAGLRSRALRRARPPAGRDSPRRHAVERHPDARGRGQAARLRRGDVQERAAGDEVGDGQGQAGVSGARAAGGQGDRRARRSVRARHRDARDADAAAPVRRRQRSRHGEADHGDGDPAPVGATATTCPRRWSGS